VKVQDLIAGVTRKLGSRTDTDAIAPLWIRDAVLRLRNLTTLPNFKLQGR